MFDRISNFVLDVEEANKIIDSDDVKRVKFVGTQPMINTNNKVYVYAILTKDNKQELLYTNDIITVSAEKVMI